MRPMRQRLTYSQLLDFVDGLQPKKETRLNYKQILDFVSVSAPSQPACCPFSTSLVIVPEHMHLLSEASGIMVDLMESAEKLERRRLEEVGLQLEGAWMTREQTLASERCEDHEEEGEDMGWD